MPNATIEVCKSYAPAEEERLLEAVFSGMVEALKIPPHDRTLRLIVHAPHRFARPSGTSDRYTLVNIDLFAGRSLEAKRALYQAIVRNLGELEIPAQEIKVLLRESPAENWGIRGGHPASEVALGFKIDV